MIPNLIVPGAGKSGTSSLHDYLDLHPDIEMSKVKEPHFFTDNKKYTVGLKYYKNLFNREGRSYYGESSTAYFGDQISLERIKKDLTNVKIIVLLREPVSRTISHYLWQVGLLQEFRSFRKAIKYNMKNPVDFRNPSWGGHFKSYYQTSLYGNNISRLVYYFGCHNIHILTTRELSEDTNSALNDCFRFLDLKPIKINVEIYSNPSKKLLGGKLLFKRFISKFIRRGILDFRLVYLLFNKRVGKIKKSDKIWFEKQIHEDKKKLLEYYPDIETRW